MKDIRTYYNAKEMLTIAKRWQICLDRIVQFGVKDGRGIKYFLRLLGNDIKQARGYSEIKHILTEQDFKIQRLDRGLDLFGQSIQRTILAGYLIGTASVGINVNGAKFSEFEPENFEDALRWFKDKEVLSKIEFDRLIVELELKGLNYEQAVQKAHQLAFTVTKITAGIIVNEIKQQLEKALDSNITLADFIKSQENWLAAQGFTDKNRNYLETVYRTNIQSAYNAGHYAEMTDPDVKDITKFWEYVAIEDDRTSEICLALNGVCLPPDDDFWSINYPPNHYNCRSTVIAVLDIPANKDVKRSEWPKDEEGNYIMADEGFRGIPGILDEDAA